MNSTILALLLACTPEKEEDDRDDSNGEEGSNYGDCFDEEDNDNDGFIDCEDEGCVNRPACNPGDTGTTDPTEVQTVFFSGLYLSIFTWHYGESETSETTFTALEQPVDPEAQASCPDCVLWGRVNEYLRDYGEHNEGFLAIDSNGQLHLYRVIQGYWFTFPNMEEGYCNQVREQEFSEDRYHYKCIHLDENGNEHSSEVNLSW